MTDTITKLGRLTKRSEFLHVREGAYQAKGGLVIQMRESLIQNDPPRQCRVGFTATKKVGNAVVRNRAKRRMREVARALLPSYGLAGYDYVFIARNTTTQRPFERLLDDGTKALLRLRESVNKHSQTQITNKD